MKVDEIRDRFLNFFKERGHTIYPSDSLVPANDPTLLFTGAGMNQFKDQFLGRVKGPKRAASCQKCLRTGDLENVGKTAGHHTFFEMLGNFSFGDYFKKEAILWAWEFLIKDLGLKEETLWVSVYQKDDEAYNIWKEYVNIPEERILRFGEKENFWPSDAPSAGPNGPCGPCSEIFYGGPDGVEVWNLVFTQFDRKDSGILEPLPNKNIDTGMGLERIARVLQNKKTNFEIDIFEPIVNCILELSAATLNRQEKHPDRFRINAIADHIRAVTFAIGDGVLPSNEERGYVVRKLIRRAFWYGRALGLEEPFLYKIVPVVVKVMKKPYPELVSEKEDIAQVILAEEERFRNTIQEGLERLEMILENCPSGIVSGEDVFRLYDTYGFPLELTEEIANSRGISLDKKGFEECMRAQRDRSRQYSKIKDVIFDVEEKIKVDLAGPTLFVDEEEIETKVLGIDKDDAVFLERTNFYGQKGGQVGDRGVLLKNGKIVAEVIDAIDIAGKIVHKVKMEKGVLRVGDIVIARVDRQRRKNICKNHTATHLLHNALRTVLGQHVRQAGSLVAPDRLRFDFTHFRPLTEDEISRVERLVNEYITNGTDVYIKELGLKEARQEGAIALFGEKYGDKVRMVDIGGYSKELCGGTHVKNTKEIQRFKIVSESSIASGIRRIEAVTGDIAEEMIKKEEAIIREIADELNTTSDKILEGLESNYAKIKRIEKALDEVGMKNIKANIDIVLQNYKEIKGYSIIMSEVKNADMEILRKTGDVIRTRFEKAVFVLVSKKDGRIMMVVGTPLGLDAVKMLNEIGKDFGIKGGGRPDLSQAGSRIEGDIDIGAVLKKSIEVIERFL